MLLALRERYGARRPGGQRRRTGALLAAGLVDEVSLLIHPALAAADARRPWHGAGPAAGLAMTLMGAETLPGGLVWSRWSVPAVRDVDHDPVAAGGVPGDEGPHR